MSKSLDEILYGPPQTNGGTLISYNDTVDETGVESEQVLDLQDHEAVPEEPEGEPGVDDVAEVIAHGLPEELVGSLRRALGTDTDEVLGALRRGLGSANENTAVTTAKIVLDAVSRMPRPRISGEIPRTVAEVAELSWEEVQAATYVLVSGKAKRLAEEHGEEEAARILWEELSPVARAVVVRAAA